MDFDAYSNRLSDLIQYFNEFLTTDNKVELIEQRRFHVTNESMDSLMVKGFIFQMD